MRSSPGIDPLLERTVAVLLVLGLAWSAFWFGGVRNGEFCVTALLVATACVLWIVRLWANTSNRFLLPPAVWAVPVFLGYAAWRHAHADIPYFSRMDLYPMTAAALVFFVALHNLHRQDIAARVVHALVLIGSLLAAYAVIQALRKSGHVLGVERPANYARRYGATFINPNHLAGFLLLVMPLGLANAFLGRAGAIVRILHGYAALLMLAGIAVTMSRGGWFGAAVALCVFSLWLWRRPQFRLPVAVLLLAIGTAGAAFLLKSDKARARIGDVAAPDKADGARSRQWIWKPAMAMWRDHRLLGVGPGHFHARFPAYRTPETRLDPRHVHNEWLQLLVEHGLAGASIVAGGLALFVHGLWRTSRHVERGASDLGVKQSNRTAFFAGAVAALAAFGVHCLVEFNLHVPANALLCALVAGMLVSNTRFATERFWFTPRTAGRVAATAIAAGMLLWFVPLAVKAAREDIHLARAADSPTVDDAFFAEVRAAARIVPDNPMTLHWYGNEKRRVSWQGLRGWEALAREAADWLEAAARIDPFNPRIRMNLGLCRQWLGDTDRAAADLEKAAVLGPCDTQVANTLAWNLISRHEYDRAREVVRRSLEWNPWDNWEARSYEAKLRDLR